MTDFLSTEDVLALHADQIDLYGGEDGVRDLGLHTKVNILPGVLPTRSVRALKYMKDEVAGMMIPDDTIRCLEGAADPAEEGVRLACELIAELREIDGVAGIHLMPVMWERITPRIVEEAGL